MPSDHLSSPVDPSTEPSGAPHRSQPLLRVISISALTAGGLALGGIGLAAAADTRPSPTPSTSSPSSSAPGVPAPDNDGLRGWMGGPGRGHGRSGHLGFGGPPGFGALHGSFVTAKPGGGYQTISTQRGTVSGVDDSSITVKSDDGYSKTYAVPAETLVNAARDGLSTVKVDAEVAVVATEDGGTATAVSLVDLSRRGHLPQRMAPAPDSSSSTAPSDFEGASTGA